MLKLDSKVSEINKIGKATEAKLKKLGIKNISDLLFHIPFRYDDFSKQNSLQNTQIGENINIIGHIDLIQNKRSFRRKMNITEALVDTGEEKIKVIWFNQAFIARQLKVGDLVSLAGKLSADFGGRLLKSPNYEKLGKTGAIHTQGLVPIYHLTANLSQKQIRFLIKQVLSLSKNIEEWLPKEILKAENLPSLAKAIKIIHSPNTEEDIQKAKDRLAFGEFFLLQIQSQLSKNHQKNFQAPQILFREKEIKQFSQNLPFKLTDDQRKCSWQIIQDMQKTSPMTRLLEGDVGSGKTMVAIIALLNTALNKKQAVLMVPTEILAQQHFKSIKKTLKNFNLQIALFTRSKKILNKNKESKASLSKKIKEKQADIIIGTHALIQEKIEFNELALVIIDEQHRFGVNQRKTLLEKSKNKLVPHFLSMTATPIPRSLALAIYGDLKISLIKEMPRGRKTIITKVVRPKQRKKAYDFIEKEIKNGRQAFVICPLIDYSEKMELKSVKEEYEKLSKEIFPNLKIAMLHGKLKPADKEKIMNDFLKKKIDILVSTSVIEVGVDVPNASLMLIEEADRFGLAQLHQFRGRVGRGKHQSYCFLFSESKSEKSKTRLKAMEDYSDGFTLSKIDLKLRGPGEVYGTSQKGFPELKTANIFDYETMNKAQKHAEKIINNDPKLQKHPLILKELQNQEKIIRPE